MAELVGADVPVIHTVLPERGPRIGLEDRTPGVGHTMPHVELQRIEGIFEGVGKGQPDHALHPCPNAEPIKQGDRADYLAVADVSPMQKTLLDVGVRRLDGVVDHLQPRRDHPFGQLLINAVDSQATQKG